MLVKPMALLLKIKNLFKKHRNDSLVENDFCEISVQSLSLAERMVFGAENEKNMRSENRLSYQVRQ